MERWMEGWEVITVAHLSLWLICELIKAKTIFWYIILFQTV